MKSLKYIAIALICAFSSPTAFSQTESEEEVTFPPIHAILSPGQLKFEEKYEKNASVYLSGDELIFKCKKGGVPNIITGLPINPNKDYTLELTFYTTKLQGFDFITLGIGNCAIVFGKKFIDVKSLVSHKNGSWLKIK